MISFPFAKTWSHSIAKVTEIPFLAAAQLLELSSAILAQLILARTAHRLASGFPLVALLTVMNRQFLFCLQELSELTLVQIVHQNHILEFLIFNFF